MTALRAGNSIDDAAAYSGMNPDTVREWLYRGRGTDKDRPPRPEHVRFQRMVDEARATARVLVVGNIVARSRYDHHAGLSWLRAHGGPEWRGEEVPPEVSGQPTMIDARQQNMIFMPADAMPELARQLVEARRRQHEQRLIADSTEAPAEQPRKVGNNGTRPTRLGNLRIEVDGSDT